MNIIGLLNKKKEMLKKMESATLDMREKLESGNIEEFISLIGSRQSIIEEIDGVDTLMESIADFAAEDNGIIDDLKHKNITILHNIVEINSALVPMVIEQVISIKLRLKNISSSRAAFNLYGRKPCQTTGFFVEKKK